VSVSLPLKSDKVPFVGITIVDRGIGMTAEQMARLGERFFRADKSGNVPGTGLGVSLAKEIAAIHGGSFEVTSQLGKGSSFTLWLPLVSPDAATPIVPVLNARESQP
jgi:signal transduction histidine kinase